MRVGGVLAHARFQFLIFPSGPPSVEGVLIARKSRIPPASAVWSFNFSLEPHTKNYWGYHLLQQLGVSISR
jgi:hypothetical protein